MREKKQILEISVCQGLECDNVSVTVLDEHLAYVEGEIHVEGSGVECSKLPDELLNIIKENIDKVDESKRFHLLILDAKHCALFQFAEEEEISTMYMDVIREAKVLWYDSDIYCTTSEVCNSIYFPIEILTSVDKLSKLVDDFAGLIKNCKYSRSTPNLSAQAALANFGRNPIDGEVTIPRF